MALVVLNMGRPAGVAPVTLRRWPGNIFHAEDHDCSQFMALVGTWQAAIVGHFYAQHIANFGADRRYYINSITIFKDENDKPAMAVSVRTIGSREPSIGAVSVLGLYPNGWQSGEQSGPQPEPHTNGVGHGGSATGQGRPGSQPESHTNDIVNGVGHGRPAGHG
jgi:hypothetical protein